MKKFIPFMFAAAALLLASCSPKPEDVAQKISKGESLDQHDYTVMLESTHQLLNQMNDSVDKYGDDLNGLVTSMFLLNQNSPLEVIFIKQLMETDPATLDEENRKLYDAVAKVQANLGERLEVIASGPVLGLDGKPIKKSEEKQSGDSVSAQSTSVVTEEPTVHQLEANTPTPPTPASNN